MGSVGVLGVLLLAYALLTLGPTSRPSETAAPAVKPHQVLWFGDGTSTGNGEIGARLPDYAIEDADSHVTVAAVGGASLGQHKDPDYEALSPEYLLRSIVSGEWRDSRTSASRLANLRDARRVDNLATIDKLEAVDLGQIDEIVLMIGRNDFMQGGPLGPADTRVTISGNPGVVVWPGHQLAPLAPVRFRTDGALPHGITPDRIYYVKRVVSPDSFTISVRPGSAEIAAAGPQSGAHRAYSRATWRGAIASFVDEARTAKPNVRIYLATPLWSAREELRGAQFADAMLDQARRLGIPAWDAFRGGGIDRANHKRLMPDGVHLSHPEGDQLVAAKYRAWRAAH